MAKHVRLPIFAGSARAEFLNKRIARLGADIAETNGLSSTLANLADYPMQLSDRDLEDAERPPEFAVKLKNLLE